MVRVYSKAAQGNDLVATNFKVKEFACKDGSDKILISEETVNLIQAIRNLLMVAITITSAYRTPAYNAKVGGAKKSQHIEGTAIDTKCVYGARILARAGMLVGFTGIGLYPYSPFCHLDTRESRSYWQQDSKNGSSYKVSGWMTKEQIKKVQTLMNKAKFPCGKVDGVIGDKTRGAFFDFCHEAPLSAKKEMIYLLKQ